jgi:hypothetical protein
MEEHVAIGELLEAIHQSKTYSKPSLKSSKKLPLKTNKHLGSFYIIPFQG